jgi:polysaccharide deacetylase family sporulation protein PdaB
MVINLRKWLRSRKLFYSIVGLLAVGALVLQVTQNMQSGPMAIAKVKTEEKVCALTFDISWGDKYSPSILDTLKKNNVKATFFIMGPWTVKYPDIARRIAMEGHEVGSHGYKHENYGEKSEEWITSDIEKAQAQIMEITGKQATLLRPPNGHYSKKSVQITDNLGCKTIIWDADSLDWRNPGTDVVIRRVLTKTKPGSIVLLHASDTPVQTAEALPTIIEGLKEQGFNFMTVGELLAKYPPVRH